MKHKIIGFILTSVFILANVGVLTACDPSASKENAPRNAEIVEIESVSISQNEIKIDKPRNYKLSKKSVSLDQKFYLFGLGKITYYVADVSKEKNIVNLSVESTRQCDFLHLSLFENDRYFYYYGILHDDVLGDLKERAANSASLSQSEAAVLLRQTDWYRRANDRATVTAANLPGDTQSSLELLMRYYTAKEEDSSEKDDPVATIVPRELFTEEGKKTGYNGMLGYYIDTLEWPKGSQRFLSEVLVWSNFVEVPAYNSESVVLETKPEFSGYYEYAPNGYAPISTPEDTIVQCEGYSHLSLKNISASVEVIPYNSYMTDGRFVDKDEYVWAVFETDDCLKFGENASLTGYSYVVAKGSRLSVTDKAHPFVEGALAVQSAEWLTAIELSGDQVVNFGYKDHHKHNYFLTTGFIAHFIADRTRHYELNGKRIVRYVKSRTSPDRFYAPDSHEDFYTERHRSRLNVQLCSSGTEVDAIKKLNVQFGVEIVDVDFVLLVRKEWDDGYTRRETYTGAKTELRMAVASFKKDIYYNESENV